MMKKYRSVLVALVVSLAFCLPAFAAELRLAQVADVSSMDPHRVSDIYSANVIRQIYSNLVQVDENMEIVPDLAEKWENPDDLTWVFHLRKGVKFHNGEPFTASDVKYSMERIKDPKTASPGATHLKEVVSVEAVDDYTVKIVTRRPFAPMLMSLTRYETSILNEKAVSAAGADYGSKAAVGTGPFKFVSWSRGDKVILEKNADYFRGPAAIDTVIYRGIPEDATRLVELESGGIDLIPGNFPYQEFENIAKNDKYLTYKIPAMSTLYMGLNTEVKPFGDNRVRKAMNYAVDKQAIVDAVYFGYGTPSRGPLSPVIWGFDPERKDAYPYDPDKARELLKEAGYADGFDMTIFSDNRTERRSAAELIQAYLAEVGIRAQIELMEWSALLSTSAKGIGGGFMLGWTGTGDADGGLTPVYHSANIGSSNRFRYKSEGIDALLEKGTATLDQDARRKVYAEAQERIVEECPLVFMISQQLLGASTKKVQGFKLYPNMISPLFAVTLAE
ncbi:glutathione ABC transporter substrate-binding protein [Aminivibrio sp.]|jgi:peptide/nickel transport system substrate-binding protein|uniref:glutathione ABC transporter substrate-binding protein n=1 Tax=Aminivibrio sp. TaxID=1872489 RepID=UPI001E12D84F|nr:glutathione ABC transporter substrate-binding protein [Synergistaceae bacterium]MDD4021875.1 glutathione ABC transporter substrate-binding protein [Synergistaceae bacterium]NCC56983.1 glutathione ABC transporter substrate-binding protein [Synergistales bacterium]